MCLSNAYETANGIDKLICERVTVLRLRETLLSSPTFSVRRPLFPASLKALI